MGLLKGSYLIHYKFNEYKILCVWLHVLHFSNFISKSEFGVQDFASSNVKNYNSQSMCNRPWFQLKSSFRSSYPEFSWFIHPPTHIGSPHSNTCLSYNHSHQLILNIYDHSFSYFIIITPPSPSSTIYTNTLFPIKQTKLFIINLKGWI